MSVGDPAHASVAPAQVERKTNFWLPPGVKTIPPDMAAPIGITGDTGVGKTHLFRQLALDKEFEARCLLIAAENPRMTLGEDVIKSGALPVLSLVEWDDKDPGAPPLLWRQAKSPINLLLDRLEEFIRARRRGERMPLVIGMDSGSGLADYQMLWYEAHKEMFESEKGKKDTYSKMWDFGMVFKQFQVTCRDVLGVTSVLTATTKPGPGHEVCIEGQMVPVSFTRLLGACFYMRSETIKYEVGSKDWTAVEANPPQHITIGRNENGKPLGEAIARYLTTMNTGEIPGKGHRNLWLRERAILPDLLRKMRGGLAASQSAP